MNKEPVSVRVAMTADDYYSLQKHFTKKPLIFLFIFLAVIFTIIGVQGTKSSPPVVTITCLAIFYIVLTVSFLLSPRRLKKIWLKQYNSNKLLHKEQTYTITPDGIEGFSDNGFTNLKWNDLHAFKETKECFMIFLSDRQVYYLPKKYFINDIQICEAQEYFQNLPKYKSEKPTRKIIIGLIFIFVVPLFIFLFALLLLKFS